MQREMISGVEESLEKIYREIPVEKKGRIFFTFQDTTYINSSGLAALIGVVSTATGEGFTIDFISLKPHIQKVMGLVGILDHVRVYPDLLSALDE